MTQFVCSIDDYLCESLPTMARPLYMAALFLCSILIGAAYPALASGATIL